LVFIFAISFLLLFAGVTFILGEQSLIFEVIHIALKRKKEKEKRWKKRLSLSIGIL
jgi:hypothetical protein